VADLKAGYQRQQAEIAALKTTVANQEAKIDALEGSALTADTVCEAAASCGFATQASY
jgi:hypothetical protein